MHIKVFVFPHTPAWYFEIFVPPTVLPMSLSCSLLCLYLNDIKFSYFSAVTLLSLLYMPVTFYYLYSAAIIGLSFLFIETRKLCEARAKLETSSNFQIYLGKTDKPSLPFETARALSELYTFQCSQWVPIRNSQIIGRYKEMSVWHQVKLMNPPSLPFETARVLSELYAFSMWSMSAHSKQSNNRKI